VENENNDKISFVRRTITIGELAAVAITVTTFILTFWISTSTRLSILENQMKDRKDNDQSVSTKIDKLTDNVNDIKIILQNKQDKK
jgi:hypothetical protein